MSEVLTPAGFEAALRETLESEITVYPARAFYPSSIGHPCDRHLVYRFTRWEQAARHSVGLQAIFAEGNLHQPSVYRRLEAMGFDVVREHDRPVQYKVGGGAVISGRPDGKLRGFRGETFPAPVILEIKTTQSHTFDKLDTMDDIANAPQHYVRAYADQGYIYALLEEVPQGVIVFKNKANGWLKLIPFTLDYERAEWLVQRVERLQGMVTKEEDPPPIPYDQGICGGCPFLALCYPPKDLGQGLALLEHDEQIIEALDRREELAAAAREYERVDNGIKKKLKGLGEFTAALAGPYMIRRSATHVVEKKPREYDRVVFDIKRIDAKQITEEVEE